MAVTTLANVAGVLKTLYPAHKIEELTLSDHPLLGLMPKVQKMGGNSFNVSLIYDNGQGRNATFATAQTGAQNPSNVQFAVTRCADYGVYQIGGEALEAAEGDEDSFIRTLKAEIDAKFRAVSKSLSHKMFRDGSASLGRVTVMPGGVVFTMSPEDAINIDVGNVLRASTGPGDQFAALRAGTMTVTAVNRATGNITCGGGLVGALAVGDDISISGDRIAGAINAHTAAVKTTITGLHGWLGSASATLGLGVAMFGVTRNVDDRLYGITDATAYATVEEGLIELAGQVYAVGGRPDVIVVNPKQFRILQKEVGAVTQYNKLPAKSFSGGDSALIGYRGIVLDGPVGPITVVADIDCMRGVGFCLTRDTWEWRSIGAAPKFLNADGLNLLRLGAADGYEGRIGYYGNLVCYAPGYNGLATNLPLV